MIHDDADAAGAATASSTHDTRSGDDSDFQLSELMGSCAQDDGLETGNLDIHPSHGRSSWYRMRCCALRTISSGHSTWASGALQLAPRGFDGLPAVRAICGSAAFLGADRNGRVPARTRRHYPHVYPRARRPQLVRRLFLALLVYFCCGTVRTLHGAPLVHRRTCRPEMSCPAAGGRDTRCARYRSRRPLRGSRLSVRVPSVA